MIQPSQSLETLAVAGASQLKLSVDLIRASYRSDDFPSDWSDEQRQRSLLRYKKWLMLKQENPTARMAPTRDIDLFWHLHMLSPVAYFKDCKHLFGRLMDHDGGFGKGEGELPELQVVFLATEDLWMQRYGEAYREDGCRSRDLVNCWHDCSNRCWHACSS